MRLKYVCIDPDIEKIEDRFLKKMAMIGKVPTNENCTKKLPECIIIGVMKGGTEAFSTFLALHPQVAMQFKMQATLFFTDINFKKGISWYKEQMPCSTSGQVTIEKSPQYWAAKETASRIYALNSNMKLIVVVREPISRALSHFLQQNNSNPNKIRGKSFEESVTGMNGDIDTHSIYIHVSSYVSTLKQWLEYFKQHQLLIIDGGNFYENPVYELRRTERFLNLTSYIQRNMFVYNAERNIYCIKSKCGYEYCLPEGKGRAHPNIGTEVLQKLREHFRPLNSEFFKMIGRDFKW